MRNFFGKIKMPAIALSDGQKQKLKISLSFFALFFVFAAKESLDFTFMGTLVLAFFAFSLIWNLSSRIVGFLALGFLASCPLLLMFGQEAEAEFMAVQAYYFLAITVILQIAELGRKQKVESKEKDAIVAAWKKAIGLIRWKNSGSGEMARPASSEQKIEKKENRRIAYVALVSLLAVEMAVVFFHWPLAVGIFLYIFIMSLVSSEKILRILFFASAVSFVFSLLGFILSQEDWDDRPYLWLLFSGISAAWTFLVGILRKTSYGK
ncbi:MAG TPA: hypothetical protein DIC35_02215 [Candidatus Moranbacteria bacterium]|nr:hypothetical protein [Candidatus Moranbacteria bacterium]